MFSPRRYSAPRLLRRLVTLHPEMARPCSWAEFALIADREGIPVRIVPFPEPVRGQILRFSGAVVIQIARRLPVAERAIVGFHELTHYWVDPSPELAFESDLPNNSQLEEFCDIFAWFVTTPHRPKLRDEPW